MAELSQATVPTEPPGRAGLSGPAAPAGSPEVLVIVCAGVVLASLDLFIVNVALPAIARDLGSRNLGDLSWVLNGYAIVYASLLVLMGKLADRYRRKYAFLLGVAIFTVASAACGAATSVAMLIGFRLVQAVGAALLTPTSLSLVLASYPAQRRSGAVRAWTATGGVAAAFGPVIGGLLVAASWRWVFLVNVPIGIAALVAGWRRLPDVPGHAVPRPDALGAAGVTAGVGALTFGLTRGGDWGWGSARTVAILAASVVLLASFVLHCARARNPLIEPALFRARSYVGATAVMFLFSMAFGAMLLSVVLWMQDDWGWSALRTGLGVAPGPVMVPLFSFLIAGRLITRFGPAAVVTAGCTVLASGVIWWALAVGLRADYAGGILGGMLLTGAGVGLTLPTLMATAAGSLPAHAFATGSAVVNMVRQVGMAIGVAVLVAVLGQPGTSAGRLNAFQHGWWAIAGMALAGAVTAPLLRRRASLVCTCACTGKVNLHLRTSKTCQIKCRIPLSLPCAGQAAEMSLSTSLPPYTRSGWVAHVPVGLWPGVPPSRQEQCGQSRMSPTSGYAGSATLREHLGQLCRVTSDLLFAHIAGSFDAMLVAFCRLYGLG